MSTSAEGKRTALVTGANSGLGKAIASALAADQMRVGLVARDRVRGEAALEEIRAATGNDDLHLFVADLADQSAIRALAQEVQERFDRLHLLVNNAGTAFPERRLSPDGVECALAVNHLAPFLLTNLLLDRLKASAPARIVNVGTRIDTALDFTDLNWDRRPYRMMQAYGQSKLGNLHFTFELARRLQGERRDGQLRFPRRIQIESGRDRWRAGPVLEARRPTAGLGDPFRRTGGAPRAACRQGAGTGGRERPVFRRSQDDPGARPGARPRSEPPPLANQRSADGARPARGGRPGASVHSGASPRQIA